MHDKYRSALFVSIEHRVIKREYTKFKNFCEENSSKQIKEHLENYYESVALIS